MLTQEGKEAACDCLKRSGMAESLDKSASVEISIHMDNQNSLDVEANTHDMESEVTSPLNQQKKPVNVPFDSLERVCFFLFKVLIISFVSHIHNICFFSLLAPFSVESTEMMSDAGLYGIFGLITLSFGFIFMKLQLD